MLPAGVRRVFRLLRGARDVPREVDEEIRFHLESRIDALMAQGWHRDAARAEAVRQLGDPRALRATLEAIDRRDEGRRARLQWRADWGLDVKFGLRSLARTPGVTAAVVVMLALGIGANAAMYGILERLFLRPPPHIVDAEGVHRVYVRQRNTRDPTQLITRGMTDWPEFRALRVDSQRLAAIAGYTYPSIVRHGRGQAAQELRVSWVTGGFFPLLGVQPAKGRLLGPGDDAPAAAPAAVIGDGMWNRYYGRADSALGGTLAFDGVTYTVVGITPAGFSGPDPSAADVWLPLELAAPASRGQWWVQAGSGFSVTPLIRIAPGASIAAVEGAATGAIRAARSGSPFQDTAATVLLGPLLASRGPDGITATLRLPLIVGGVALVVLLVAMANVTNLLLLRAVARRRELAVRSALGAARWRIGRLLVVESLMLALVSAVGATAVAAVTGRLLRVTLLPRYQWASGALDGRVLMFAALAALAIGLVTGLVPALQAARSPGVDDLRSGVRTALVARSRVRSALLVVQASLSLVLLVGAAVFYRSFAAARNVDIGYARDQLLTVSVDGGTFQRPQPIAPAALAAMEHRLRAMPGVVGVAQSTNAPMYSARAIRLRIRGTELPRMSGPYINAVSPNFFDVADLRVVQGRGLTDGDGERAPRVAVVNEVMARLVWPGDSPIGECLYVGVSAESECTTVVGVVEAPLEFGLRDTEGTAQYYVPILQNMADDRNAANSRTFVVRSRDPDQLVRPALAALAELFPDLTRDRVRSLAELFAPQIRRWKIGTGLFAAAAGLALLLAAIGLYSIIAFAARQRRFEFGIRRALGATTRDIVWLVVRHGFALAVVGVALGAAASWWAARFVAPLLFANLSPRDPAALAAAGGVLLSVALVASLLPSREAARTDPREALQAE